MTEYRLFGRTGVKVSPLCLGAIGPRTFEQLDGQLGADKITLSRDVLDRIDETVPPGTNLVDRDAGYTPPAIADPALRRRSAR